MEVSSPKHPLILGHPWLCRHDPAISWQQGELLSWSSTCFSSCLSLPCRATTIEDSASAVPPTKPSEDAQYSNVFSKIKASTPPPHRPGDCAIDLLPGVSHLRAVFTPYLSRKLRQWRTTLMKHSNSLICPSSSAASSFFFVGKKDGGLRPCIDYCSLNDVTVSLFL